jgi:hypothetical protein
MLKLKKKVAFELMVKSFGPWNTWGRAEHLAYGLIRGVEYSRMERYSNDNPHSVGIARDLWQIGAWEEHQYAEGKWPPRACYDEVEKLVVWVKKPIRVIQDQAPTEVAAQ